MRHWSQIGIRNWRVKPGRTAGAIVAIALGVGVVVWVTCAFQSARLALLDQAWFWIGKSHIAVESVYGAEGSVFQSITQDVKKVPNVAHVTHRLKYKVVIYPVDEEQSPEGATVRQLRLLSGLKVEAVGIDPATEYIFRDYQTDRFEGRLIQQDDTDALMVERKIAEQLNLKIGDRCVLRSNPDDPDKEKRAVFHVIGLLEYRRVAKRQPPIVVAKFEQVQALAHFDDDIPRVTKIDIMLSSLDKMIPTLRAIKALVDRYQQGFVVTSSLKKVELLRNAEQQSGFIMLLISSVALFTALFIIFSTLSMGMAERVGQLGLLRCVGVSRFQVGALVLSEAIPMGLVGMVLGLPVGIFLAWLSVKIAPEYVGELTIDREGIWLALAGGGITILLGALLPMIQAMRISPMAAARPYVRPPHSIFVWIAAILGTGMIFGHSWMIENLSPHKWFINPLYPISGVMLLFCGYALIAPALIRIFGWITVVVVAKVLGIRRKLLHDQIGRAVWRSGAICCGLMVGLAMIVTMVVHTESISRGWNFPKDFFESFVYVIPPIPREQADQIRRMPGVAESCLINEGIRCSITTHGPGIRLNFAVSRFIAGDPEEFFNVVKLEFIEGNKEEAVAKLKKGGYVLVTPEFTRVKNLSYGDKIVIKQAHGLYGRARVFEIAGVVTSPALDIAANYFNAGGMLAAQSVLVAMGTLEDARRVFQVPDEISMFLLNFDLPKPDKVPAEFNRDSPPEVSRPAEFVDMLTRWQPMMAERKTEIDEFNQLRKAREAAGEKFYWEDAPLLIKFHQSLTKKVAAEWTKLTPMQRWQAFREDLVMQLLAEKCGSSARYYESVRGLKDRIDRDLRQATALFTTIPMVALIVAALGVANLMMANVTNRVRQIAMLRAVGATKWQVSRLVIGEAMVLGGIGSLLGVVLGLHAAHAMCTLTTAIWGYKPEWTIPWMWVGQGIAFTMLICLIAGVLPARHASRNNIIDAMQTT